MKTTRQSPKPIGQGGGIHIERKNFEGSKISSKGSKARRLMNQNLSRKGLMIMTSLLCQILSKLIGKYLVCFTCKCTRSNDNIVRQIEDHPTRIVDFI
jgi:hypothetical protein